MNVCLDEENMDKACGGTVLRCLADKIDDINDDTCKQELLYFQKMEVTSARPVYCCFSAGWHAGGAWWCLVSSVQMPAAELVVESAHDHLWSAAWALYILGA